MQSGKAPLRTSQHAFRLGSGLFNRIEYQEDSGCWNFTGSPGGRGYGQVCYGGKKTLAHRLAMILWRGMDFYEPRQVMHLCNNKICCNPKHLKIGTIGENNRAAHDDKLTWQSRRTRCPSGHEYSGWNLMITHDGADGRPRRKCRACTYERNRKQRNRSVVI